eukprot:9447318-Pyramimonas_sp.AAC.1
MDLPPPGVWLRQRVLLVPNLPDSAVKRHVVTAAVAEPTMLVVNVAVGSVSRSFCGGHAPHSKHDKGGIEA